MLIVLLAFAMAGCTSKANNKQADATNIQKTVDYCALVSKAELAKLDRKPLYAKGSDNGCMWSEKSGGMAYLDVGIFDSQRKLRTYFATDLPSNVKLVKITDLGDAGLMSVADGTIGVVAIRKGNKILQSAATFLDIKPGSEGQKVLWQIYGSVLNQ